MGIRAEDFWKLNFKKLRPYLLAENIKREQQNYMLWLQGLYIYDAVGAIAGQMFSKGKKPQYRKEPIRITPLTEQEKLDKQQEEIDKVVKWLDSLEVKDGHR